jgi:voltage-gated potassium channel
VDVQCFACLFTALSVKYPESSPLHLTFGAANGASALMAKTLCERTYISLEPRARLERGLFLTNKLIYALIVCSAVAAILEPEVTVLALTGRLFLYLEWIFTTVFLVGYLTRLWVARENPKYNDGMAGVFRYAGTPAAVLDVLAIAPILITVGGGSEAFILRLFRLLRLLRLARLGRFSEAMNKLSRPADLDVQS